MGEFEAFDYLLGANVGSRPVENACIGTHVDAPPVNFAALAESFGVYREERVRRSEELGPALERRSKPSRKKRPPARVDVIAKPR